MQLHAFGNLVIENAACRLLAELIGAAQTDAELTIAYRALYSSERRHLAVARMERAQTSGQLRADVDSQVVVDQLWGAVHHRLLIPDEPITTTFIVALLDNLLDGILTRGHRAPQQVPRVTTRFAVPGKPAKDRVCWRTRCCAEQRRTCLRRSCRGEALPARE